MVARGKATGRRELSVSVRLEKSLEARERAMSNARERRGNQTLCAASSYDAVDLTLVVQLPQTDCGATDAQDKDRRVRVGFYNCLMRGAGHVRTFRATRHSLSEQRNDAEPKMKKPPVSAASSRRV